MSGGDCADNDRYLRLVEESVKREINRIDAKIYPALLNAAENAMRDAHVARLKEAQA